MRFFYNTEGHPMYIFLNVIQWMRMKKILLGLGVIVMGAYAYHAAAFWPFETSWANNPTQKKIWIDDNGYQFMTNTEAQTVGDFLSAEKIPLGSDDYLFPEKDSKTVAGMKVVIKRALPVSIKADGESKNIKTFTHTVEDALKDAGVTLSRLDKVEPSKHSPLEKDLKIVVTRINEEEVTVEEDIDFQVVEKDDPKLKWRKQRVEQEGERGTKEVKYKITYTNGKQTSKVVLSSEVTKKPVSKIIHNGTKIEVGKVTKGRASWYAYTNTMACASLQFPKGTWLRVTSTASGKQVIVQVNDSGPYAPDKIIDLDKVAFQKLVPLGAGVTNVKVEEILE